MLKLTAEELEKLEPAELVRLNADLERLHAEQLATSFRDFIPEAFRIIEPETEFTPGWHIDAVADHLQACSRGEIRNLIINIPPRHMKSLETSVLWPAWEWIGASWLKFLCTSYESSLALRDAGRTRRLVESPWYQARWPHVQLTKDQNAKEYYENTKGGYRASAGIGGGLLGKGGDRIIVDDAHNTKHAESDIIRESVIEAWRSTIVSRVQDARTAVKVVVAQRVHQRDLPGYLLDQGGWTHLCLPEEYDPKPFLYIKARKPITQDPRSQEGELLWAERFGPAEVAEAKTQGSYHYSAQYQQRPVPAGGGIIKREWFKRYDVDPRIVAQECELVIQSWDLAVKGETTSDHVSGQVWGKRKGDAFLLARINAIMTFSATCRAIEAMAERWPMATLKLIEDKANGPAVIDDLKHRIPGLVAQPVYGDKTARLVAVSGYVESGNVYLPSEEHLPQINDFIDEICDFPKAPHKDDVDAFSQAMVRLFVSGANWNMQEYHDLAVEQLKREHEIGYNDPTWKETITPGGISRMKTIGEAPLLPEYAKLAEAEKKTPSVHGW